MISAIPAEFLSEYLEMQDLDCCCGLYINKESIVACLLKGTLEKGLNPRHEIRKFGTPLKDLLALRQWLEEKQCHSVAMERTGINWQPIYAVLETAFSNNIYLLVVNARHMKQVPGRKTDMRDVEPD